MELNQLEYFLTVAKLQHVTRAAEALSITQPALSHSIARLEEELGVPLFERSGRNVRLNRYGRLFARRVESILQEIRRGKQELAELIHPETGLVSIAYLNILGVRMIPHLIRQFNQRYPNVRFELQAGTHSFILQQLEEGLCDFCIASPQKMRKEGTVWQPLTSHELYAVVPHHHRLAAKGEIDLQDLADDSFIGLSESCGLRMTIDDIFLDAGFQPRVSYEVEDLHTVAGFVSAGLGVALLPKVKELEMDGVAWLKVRKPRCVCLVGLEWKEGRYISPAAKLFRDFLLEKYQVFG